MHALAQRGVTLVELVVSIVVISIGLAGVLLVITRNVLSSADPLIQHQAVAIAEAYLEEILAKDFSDPDGGETGGPEPGETRPTYDDVNDYNGLVDNGARNQDDTAVGGLESYGVSVEVVNDGLHDIAAANAQRVTVTVTDPSNAPYVMSGYRTNYQ